MIILLNFPQFIEITSMELGWDRCESAYGYFAQIVVWYQGVNLTWHIGIQMFGFQKHFFNPISADAALSTKAVNKSQTHMSQDFL